MYVYIYVCMSWGRATAHNVTASMASNNVWFGLLFCPSRPLFFPFELLGTNGQHMLMALRGGGGEIWSELVGLVCK